MSRREWNIPPLSEYRFEVGFDATATVKLTSGTAEVFGAELAPNREYLFTGQKVAIFSFDSAVLSVSWSATGGNSNTGTQVEYVSSESVTVPLYLHLFKQELPKGKRILILGSGRNTLTRTLCNYAVRSNQPVLWASVDPRTNPLFFPGCLSANVMLPMQVVEAEEPGMVGGMAAEACSPFTVFFGSLCIADNYKLWLRLVERLAVCVGTRLGAGASDVCGTTGTSDAGTTGASDICGAGTTGASEIDRMVICGPGEQEIDAIPTLPEDLIKALSVDTVVVVGNERLHARLQRHLIKIPTCRLLKVAKSGGHVPHPRPNQHDHLNTIRLLNNYFYGHHRQLNPFSQTLLFGADFHLYRMLLGSDDVAPMSALPLGATRKLDECRGVKAELSTASLLYSIVAVLHQPDAKADFGGAIDFAQFGNVAGFLYVTAVDEQRQTMTVLSPCPGHPPSRLFVCGRLKWIE